MEDREAKYDEWEAIARSFMRQRIVTKTEIETCICALKLSGRPILDELKAAKKKAKTYKELAG